jgi:outer membrane protein assembly factor BamB
MQSHTSHLVTSASANRPSLAHSADPAAWTAYGGSAQHGRYSTAAVGPQGPAAPILVFSGSVPGFLVDQDDFSFLGPLTYTFPNASSSTDSVWSVTLAYDSADSEAIVVASDTEGYTQWAWPLGTPIVEDLIVHEYSNSVVASAACTLTSIEADFGALRWKTAFPSPASPASRCTLAAPADSNTIIVSTSANGTHVVLAVDALSGNIIWQYSPPLSVAHNASSLIHPTVALTPSGSSSVVAFGAYFAVDLKTGIPRWTQSRTQPATTTTAVATPAGHLVVVAVSNGNATVLALSAATGSPAWVATCPNGTFAADLAMANDHTIVVTCFDPKSPAASLALFDADRGTALGILSAPANLLSATLLATDANLVLYFHGYASPLSDPLSPMLAAAQLSLSSAQPSLALQWTTSIPPADVDGVGVFTPAGALGADGMLWLRAGRTFSAFAGKARHA